MMITCAILVLCFAVGCYSTVIQPCGPRMCEQLIQMAGTNRSSFDSESLVCNLTGRYIETKEERQKLQMRCVMCTGVPSPTRRKLCQTVDGHIVCVFMTDGRSCVFTTNMPVIDLNTQTKGIDYKFYCGIESGLIRQQRQMSCVMISRLGVAKAERQSQGKEGNNLSVWSKQMKAGVKVLLRWSTINPGKTRINKLESCNTDMHETIRQGDIQLLRKQIRETPDTIDCPGYYNITSIMLSAIHQRDSMFNLLLALGAGISIVDSHANSVFHSACECGSLYIAKLLVDVGVDVNKRGDNGRTPLLMAARIGNIALFDFLLSTGCDVTAVDDNGDNILHQACHPGHGFVKYIMEKNFRGTSAGLPSILKRGIEHINIEARNKLGETPLTVCVHWGRYEMVKYLHELGCNMGVIDKAGNTLIHHAIDTIYLPRMLIFIISLKKIDLNHKNNLGQTALDHALYSRSRPDAAKYLKDHMSKEIPPLKFG